MDQEKLAALRKRYLDISGDTIYDENFKKVSQLQFKEGVRTKPYSGIPTLLDMPACQSAEGLDVALIGVPMDLGVTNRPGARFGPRAVRAMERVGPYNHGLAVLPQGTLAIGDIGDVPFSTRYSLEESLKDIETYYKDVLKSGALPLSVGGDHSITYPILKAVGEHKPVGMVHIDAHCDTSGEFEGAKFHHGGPFRHAVLDGVLDPDRSIQIGIRGSAEYLWEFSYEAGMTVVHAEEFASKGVEAIIAAAKKVVGEEPFYITIDVDGIDPAFTPGTGTPEVGGLTPLDVQRLLRGLKGLDVVGGDVVEIAPQYDANTTTTQVGTQLLFEILSLMAVRERA
jgi:agmatinase